MGIIDRTGAHTMLYLTCTMISSVDLAYYGVIRAKDLVSVDCGTKPDIFKTLVCSKECTFIICLILTAT